MRSDGAVMVNRGWKLLLAVALALAAWLAAGMICRAVVLLVEGGDTVVGQERQQTRTAASATVPGDYQEILRRNLFGSRAAVPATVAAAADRLQPQPAVPEQAASLGLTLLGTVIGERRPAKAVIRDDVSKKQGLYGEGETVGSATIRRIERNRVTVAAGGRETVLTVDLKGDGGASAGLAASTPARQDAAGGGGGDAAGALRLTRTRFNNALNNAGRIVANLSIQPYEENGRQEGYQVSRIAVGSFLDQLGVRNNDVVQAVNGIEIRTMADVQNVYQRFKDGSDLEVEILRAGQKQTLRYEIR
ncbi:MAG: type II secretion system protein N [Thermodesulfobacteriota bacterium]